MNQKELILKALKDPNFKKKLLAQPKKTIEEEFKISIPSDIEIHVLQETENKHYLVLPFISSDLSEKELEQIAAGNLFTGGVLICITGQCWTASKCFN